MSYMDRENILTESQIDNILKLLRKDGKGKEADKIENDKRLQKNYNMGFKRNGLVFSTSN